MQPLLPLGYWPLVSGHVLSEGLYQLPGSCQCEFEAQIACELVRRLLCYSNASGAFSSAPEATTERICLLSGLSEWQISARTPTDRTRGNTGGMDRRHMLTSMNQKVAKLEQNFGFQPGPPIDGFPVHPELFKVLPRS